MDVPPHMKNPRDHNNVDTVMILNQADRGAFHFHNMFIEIKFNYSNFSIYKHQLLKILKILELQSYVFQDFHKELLLNRAINLEFMFWKI